MADTAGTYLSISVGDGDCCYAVDQSCEGAVAVAYRAYHLEGRNSILSLTLWDGDELTIAVSRITDFALTSASGRAKHLARRVEVQAAEKAAFEGWGGNDG